MSNDLQVKKGVSPISKQAAFSKASAHFQESLDVIIDVMRTSKNDNARLGAAKTIINKCLPDLKATELTGKDGGKLEGLLLVRTTGDKVIPVAEQGIS